MFISCPDCEGRGCAACDHAGGLYVDVDADAALRVGLSEQVPAAAEDAEELAREVVRLRRRERLLVRAVTVFARDLERIAGALRAWAAGDEGE